MARTEANLSGKDSDPYSAQERTLLLVEDEAPCRNALTRLLVARGYSVCAVESAEEALELISDGEHLPRYMVIDVDLPGISGLELARQVCERNPEIRPMLVTAADRRTVEAFCTTREVRYFPKPLDIPCFLRHIEGQERSN